MSRRLLPLAVVAILTLAACGAADGSAADRPSTTAGTGADAGPGDVSGSPVEPRGGSDGEPFLLPGVRSSPRNVTTSGLGLHRDRSTPDGVPEPLVEFDEVRSGGPPPDGIPPVDEPRFLRVEDVDFLADNEPVLALEIDGRRPRLSRPDHDVARDRERHGRWRARHGVVLPTVQLGGCLRPPARRPGARLRDLRDCCTTRRSSCTTGRPRRSGATSPARASSAS